MKKNNAGSSDKLLKTDTPQIPRLDKWLWAARFFKTRQLAKQAVEGGKVHCQGQRVKPSMKVTLNISLQIRQGFDEKTVVVTGLSDRRGNAASAEKLYTETPESMEKRLATIAARKADGASLQRTAKKPNKHDRARIKQFKEQS